MVQALPGTRVSVNHMLIHYAQYWFVHGRSSFVREAFVLALLNLELLPHNSRNGYFTCKGQYTEV